MTSAGTGTSAVVTGGASGLGAATARMLLARHIHVVVLDRDTSAMVKPHDDESLLHLVPGDVTSADDGARAVALAQELGELRVVVNCAGIGHPGRVLDRHGQPMDLADFRRVVDVNLTGTFNISRLGAAAMAGQPTDEDGGRGLIVMTASAAAFEAQPGQVPYAASKAALVGMTLALARDLAPRGIRVVTISPGTFDTPLYSPAPEIIAAAPPEVQDKIRELHARLAEDLVFPPRIGRPEEYASLVGHLIDNKYLNGEVIRLDAGLRMRQQSAPSAPATTGATA